MPQTGTIRDAILDAAESRARAAGYNGFSFRELAADVGIKSASVHYHFPTKGDLAFALMERYREKALAVLDEPADAATALARVIDLFRDAARSGEMCLCGAMGASAVSLPSDVRQSAEVFSRTLVDWLRRAPQGEAGLPLPPEAIVALLEGALLLSVTAREAEFFERAIAPLNSHRA